MSSVNDRRLGSHLLLGLKVLVSCCCYDDDTHAMNQTDDVSSKLNQFIIKQHNNPDLSLIPNFKFNYVNARCVELNHYKMRRFSNMLVKIDHQTGYRLVTIDANLENSWNDTVNLLTNSCHSSYFSQQLFSYVYSTIGYETGKILGEIHKRRSHIKLKIRQTDFNDRHLNADANNYVIIPPDSNGLSVKQQIIAYLDLGVALCENTAEISSREFDLILWKEFIGMMQSLVNTDSVVDISHNAKLNSLHEIMLSCFIRGYGEGLVGGEVDNGGGGEVDVAQEGGGEAVRGEGGQRRGGGVALAVGSWSAGCLCPRGPIGLEKWCYYADFDKLTQLLIKLALIVTANVSV